MSKIEFKMTAEELQSLKDSSKPAMYLVANGKEPVSPQESANMFWKNLAGKYGFVWDSVEPAGGKSNEYFLATKTRIN